MTREPTYDSRNRLTGITDWTGRTTTLAYDGAGRLLTLTRPNGTVRANTWDAASQLTAVMDKHTASGKPVMALKLGYDAAGRLTDKFEVPNIGVTVTPPVRSATYNLDNQIVSQTIGGVARTITSDPDGNITSAPAPDGTNTLQPYGWNTRNQLMSAPGSTGAPGGLTYSYDAEGLRTSYAKSGQTTTFVNDPHVPLSRLLWRIRPDGTRTFYIHGPVLLYEIEESASGGNPVNAARYYHYDHLGSTIALSNDAGKPVARANYSAYGILIGSTGTLNTPFQWQGAFGVQSDPNGLYHMRARYYHCYLGRFISEDPIGLSGGPNMYAYCNGNPIMGTDPLGLAMFGLFNSWGDYFHGVGDVWKGYWDATGGAVVGTAQAIGNLPSNVAGIVSASVELAQSGHGGTALAGAAADAGTAISQAVSNYGDRLGSGENRAWGQVIGTALTLGGAKASQFAMSGKTGPLRQGEFYINNWAGYPESIPKPTGPLRLLGGAEYDAARAAANQTNRAMHAADNSLAGWQLHEIKPVKFGGSPTDIANKMPLPAGAHSEVTSWWNSLQRSLK